MRTGYNEERPDSFSSSLSLSFSFPLNNIQLFNYNDGAISSSEPDTHFIDAFFSLDAFSLSPLSFSPSTSLSL